MRKDFKTADKYCEYCGNKMERKRYVKRYEDYGSFLKRKYCNQECMSKAYMEKEKHGKSKERNHEYARRIKPKDKCELCGSDKNLDIHHKDEDWTNNSIDNLICLCRSCHIKTHRPKQICNVDGCNKYVKGYGYCEKHYQRFKKTGNPLLTKYDLRKVVV